MTNKKLGVAKLQLAFWCHWLWRVLRLCDMSNLLFIGTGMTRPNTGQRI